MKLETINGYKLTLNTFLKKILVLQILAIFGHFWLKKKRQKTEEKKEKKKLKKMNVLILSNLQKSNFHPQKKEIGQNQQNRNFPKKGFGVNLYTLMISNFIQNIKEI